MANPSDYVQIISACIYAGALGVSLLSVLEVRRNMHVQVEHQLYLDILSFASRLWTNDIFFKMANESPQLSRYHALVDSPQEYHNITDLIYLNSYFAITLQK